MLSYISLILAYFMLFVSFSFEHAMENFFDKELYSLKAGVMIKGKVVPDFLTKRGIELVEFKTPEKIYKESSFDVKKLIKEIGGEIPFISCAVIRVKDINILNELKEKDGVLEVVYPYSLRDRLIKYKNSIKKYTFYFPIVSSLIFLLFFLFDKRGVQSRRWIKISISFVVGFLIFLGLIFYIDSFFLLNFKVFLGILIVPYIIEGILK